MSARENADAANDGTPEGRVYSRLLHLQLDFRQYGDEEAERVLCDVVLDPFFWRVLIPNRPALAAAPPHTR